MIDSLLIENFRCFAGIHDVPLRPLTILVGENSSGKSTLLAATRLAWDCGATLGDVRTPDFNEEPFQLGAYRQIATVNGKRGSVSRFSLGLGIDGAKMRVSFEESAAQPYLAQENAPEDGSFQSFSDRARSRPIAFAPIRIRPKRTYDPVQDLPDPSGIHVPMILARIRATDSTSWERIAQMLRRFGQASGLLQDLEVRRLGQDDDPFQVEVKIHW